MRLLSVDKLHVAFGKLIAVADLSFFVDQGEIVTLIGANGAGKSSLLNAVMGLIAPSAGAIAFLGRPLVGMRTHEIARIGIAYVPEGRGTLRQLTVRENLVLGVSSNKSNLDSKLALDEALQRFPILGERLNQVAGTLSGGEQQMLVIARALMSRPRLLLLDEPTLGLAPLIAEQILATVAALRSDGMTVVLVEQNAHAALKLADRAYVIEMGRIVLEGTDLLGDDRVRKAYLAEL